MKQWNDGNRTPAGATEERKFQPVFCFFVTADSLFHENNCFHEKAGSMPHDFNLSILKFSLPLQKNYAYGE
ncbi:MAG: hypothetical protein LBN98_05805 [Prevotellaceae bacterium]|jgi:hypothetical protein|nr:hypothetical protein [Prevotellaceae bacterium]